MDVRNCRSCGRLYNYMEGMPICPLCKEKLEEKFIQVKEYIRENKDATISEIAEANDVKISQIEKWIREERLTFADDSPLGVKCENCGAMIKTGRFCKKCKDTMASDLSAAITKKVVHVEPKKEQRDKGKMRFLDSM